MQCPLGFRYWQKSLLLCTSTTPSGRIVGFLLCLSDALHAGGEPLKGQSLSNSSNTPSPKQDLASTGVDGLDDILGGGLPMRHLYLVEGSPGTGKTTLALQFLLEGREKGERGLYITLSETSEELVQVAQSHGWTLEGVEIYDLVGDEGLSEDA